jgi:hypothetical protein
MNEKQKNCEHEHLIAVEYEYGHPGRYDGISEYLCTDCGLRRGRWSNRILEGDDYERRYGALPEDDEQTGS